MARADEMILWQDIYPNGDAGAVIIQLRGCPLNCPGCKAWDDKTGYLSGVERVATIALSHGKRITILGGEPFYQAKSLVALLHLLAMSEADVTVHTCAYHIADLEEMSQVAPEIAEVMALADRVVDRDGMMATARVSIPIPV